MSTTPLNQSNSAKVVQKVKALTPEQIQQINACLLAIGEYGEIHLIVQRSELRFINKVESYKVVSNDSGR